MKKIFSFMLMATALLISGNAGAATLTVGTVESGATYQDLSSAITAAAADDEIQLLSDVDFNATITIGKKLTFNLNGKTLKLTTASKYLSLTAATTYTFKDGTIVDGGVKAGSGLIYINKASAKLILENVEISSPTAGGYAIYANTSSTIQLDGTTSLQGATGMLYVKAGATVINNAALEGIVNVAKGKSLTYSGTGSLVLTGGYLPKGWELPTGVSIADGKIGVNTWNATYGECLQIAAGTDVVAKIGNYEYAAVSTAITAATTANPGGQEVILQKDADLTAAATMVAGSTLDLNGFTLHPTVAAAVLTCNTQDGAYTIKSGKIDAGEIKPTQLISIASKTGISLNLEDVDLVNKGTYDVYSTVKSSTLNFDAATTFTKGVYAKVASTTTSPLTIIPPTGQENDYVMTNVAAGGWRMVKIADAKFTVTDGENTTYHSVWGEALYDAKLAAGKTLKMFDDVTLTVAATLHNGTLDMNEHAISINGNVGITCCPADNAEVTIKNGTISTTATKSYAALLVNAKTGAQVSLQNVKVSAPSYYPVQLNTKDKSNTLNIDADCELTGKTYAMYVTDACTPTINNYATLIQNIYATDGPSLTINNYGTIPGITWSKANAKNHIINNYAGRAIVFNPNQTLSGQVTLHNEGSMDIQKIVSNMVITGNGTFKLVKGSYVNIDLPFATYVDLAEGTIIAATDKEDVGAAPDGLKWVDILYNNIAACQLVDKNAEPTCQIGTCKYYSLKDAIAAVPTNDVQTMIEMIADEDIDVLNKGNYYTVSTNQNIVLDLNGYTISAEINNKNDAHAIICNNGTLTIQDNTDVTSLGSGTGKMQLLFSEDDYANVAQNLISNNGNLTIKSGTFMYESQSKVIGYIIDEYTSKAATLTIEGGKFVSYGPCIRLASQSTVNMSTVNIIDGDFTSQNSCIFFVQDPSGKQSGQMNLTVTGGTTHSALPMIWLWSTGIGCLQNTSINISGTVVSDNQMIAVEHSSFTAGEQQSLKEQLQPLYDKIFNITGGTFLNADYQIITDQATYDPATGHYGSEDVEQETNVLPTIIDGTYYKPNSTENPNVPTEIIINHLENKNATQASDINNEDEAYTIESNIEIPNGQNAEAYNITVKDNVVLTVKNGAVLTIGDGGMTIEDGAKVIVEAGGILKVGANGIIGEGANALEVYSDETGSGVVAISPQAFLHQSPELKVIMKTRGYRTTTGSKFQFFAVPTKDAADLHWPITLNSWFYEFDPMIGDAGDWSLMASTADMIPFKGYIMTNNSTTPWQEYTMEGAVNGRDNANIVLKGSASKAESWNLLGNSYLAPIDAATLLKGVQVTGDAGIELSIAIYDAAVGQSNSYLQASKASLDEGDANFSVIPPMNAFFMNLKNMDEAGFTIDYANCVWNQDPISTQAMYAPKRSIAKPQNIKLNVAAEGMTDRVLLRESDKFTSAFDNGYEVTKMMNDEMNLYVNADAPMAELATNDLNGTTLAFQAGNAVEYTMTFSNGLNDNFVLVDNANGARVAMTDGATYTFVATPNSTDANRFEIRKITSVVTGNEDAVVDGRKDGTYLVNDRLVIVKDGKAFNVLGL